MKIYITAVDKNKGLKNPLALSKYSIGGFKMALKKVKEFLAENKGEGKAIFSRNRYDGLLKVLLNDRTFETEIREVVGGKEIGLKKVIAADSFRRFLKNAYTQLGYPNKNELDTVLSEKDITNVDGLYEFFAIGLQAYLNSGNTFATPAGKDNHYMFTSVAKKKDTKRGITRNIKTGEATGTYEIEIDAHRALKVLNGTPKFVKHRKK